MEISHKNKQSTDRSFLSNLLKKTHRETNFEEEEGGGGYIQCPQPENRALQYEEVEKDLSLNFRTPLEESF